MSAVANKESSGITTFTGPCCIGYHDIMNGLCGAGTRGRTRHRTLGGRTRGRTRRTTDHLTRGLTTLMSRCNTGSRALPSNGVGVANSFGAHVRHLRTATHVCGLGPNIRLSFASRRSLAATVRGILILISRKEVGLSSVSNHATGFGNVTSSRRSLQGALRTVDGSIPGLISTSYTNMAVDNVSAVGSIVRRTENTSRRIRNVVMARATSALMRSGRSAPPILPIINVLASPCPYLILRGNSEVVRNTEFNRCAIGSVATSDMRLDGNTNDFA